MPTRDTAPMGAPCWVDLSSTDAERARAFYCDLFGWTADEPNPEFGGYFSFRKDGQLIAGAMAFQPDMGVPDVWSIYLATDDAAKTVEVAAAAGAQVVSPAMAVGDLGTMAVLIDPTGAAIGLWQPGTHPGFKEVGENCTPSWFELHTRDYAKAVEFYRDAFRWHTVTAGDTPEFRYTMQVDGEQQLAGIMDAGAFLPEGVPAHWKVYFGVDDADATVSRLVELGGSVVLPAEDTPYGRIAEVTDPMGAHFKLVAPNEQMPAHNT